MIFKPVTGTMNRAPTMVITMKPVAIFRHTVSEGPGYLADFLNEQNVPWKLICIDAGDFVPVHANNFSGLVFMGGPMSVNDDLPWIPKVLALIRQAVEKDIPVLGHCLGGQLMSKALGGIVTANPVKEIGWGKVTVLDNDVAREWFGDVQEFDTFHWHGETFSLPPGATHILSGQYCANQAFAMGKHLAMQCHVEMTPALVQLWCDIGSDEIAASARSPAVQPASVIQAQMVSKLPKLYAIAGLLYPNWIKGLAN